MSLQCVVFVVARDQGAVWMGAPSIIQGHEDDEAVGSQVSTVVVLGSPERTWTLICILELPV